MKLDEQVAFFIAKHIRSNVRELEGALKRVTAYSSFHGLEISLTVAKRCSARSARGSESADFNREHPKTVADYYKIRVSDMHSKKEVARNRPAAPGRDGAGQANSPSFRCRKWQQFRRPGPHHRAPRLPPDREASRLPAGNEPRRKLPAAGPSKLVPTLYK